MKFLLSGRNTIQVPEWQICRRRSGMYWLNMSQQCHMVVINVRLRLGSVNRHLCKKQMKDLFHTIDDDQLHHRYGCLFNLQKLVVSFFPPSFLCWARRYIVMISGEAFCCANCLWRLCNCRLASVRKEHT